VANRGLAQGHFSKDRLYSRGSLFLVIYSVAVFGLGNTFIIMVISVNLVCGCNTKKAPQ